MAKLLNGIENIEGLTAEQIEKLNGLAGGLASKNGDVIGKNALLKAQVEQLEKDALDLKRKAAEEANDVVELNRLNTEAAAKSLTAAEERALILEGTNKELKSNLEILLIDGGLNDALDGVGINPLLKTGAISMLRSGAVLVDGKAMIGEKSLSDAVKEWANSLAAQNGNGDGLGGSNQGSQKSFSEMSLTERTVLANTDPNLYQQLQGN